MSGDDDRREAARDDVRRVLERHAVPPLPDDVAQRLRELVDEADREAGTSHTDRPGPGDS